MAALHEMPDKYLCVSAVALRDALIYVNAGSMPPDDDGRNAYRVGYALRRAGVGMEVGDWGRWLSANDRYDVGVVQGSALGCLNEIWEWFATPEAEAMYGEPSARFVIDAALNGDWDGRGTPFEVRRDPDPEYEADLEECTAAFLPEQGDQGGDDECGLPRALSLADVWEDPPARPPVLIGTESRGLLRRGHVGVESGPSKAGKSWHALELCVAVATGTGWCGFTCAAGVALYVNLEIDGRSCLHRLKAVAEAVDPSADFGREVAGGVYVLNLRGTAASTDEYADHIIGEANAIGGVALIVIDPLGMYSDADENSNSQMKCVMASLNRIATETGASVLTVHHYAKGRAGGKLAIDRASGAGMIARSPDCIIDLAPLEPPDDDAADALGDATAWRMTATLREFRPIAPVDLIFSWPRHLPSSSLEGWEVQGADAFAEGRRSKRKHEAGVREARADLLRRAFMACATSDALTEANGVTGALISELWASCGADAETGRRPDRRTISNWCGQDWSPVRRVNVAEDGKKPSYLYVLDGWDAE